jgi:arylsulfatase A-like enzyme
VACSPSRASLYTGHYPSLHGVTNTTGAAKDSFDPDVFWLDPNSVPTLGDYFRAAGYRTFWKGKWHASEADLLIPGTHQSLVSYHTTTGVPDRAREAQYLAAERLGGYGFSGWIGPEPHGSSPLNSGSSAKNALGRDVGFADQTRQLIQDLAASPRTDPWLIVASFVNPHDIALFGLFANLGGSFDFTVESVVPHLLFDPVRFQQSVHDDLAEKPSCQASAQQSYSQWMQPILDRETYSRFYYQLHKNVPEPGFWDGDGSALSVRELQGGPGADEIGVQSPSGDRTTRGIDMDAAQRRRPPTRSETVPDVETRAMKGGFAARREPGQSRQDRPMRTVPGVAAIDASRGGVRPPPRPAGPDK